MYSFRNDYSEGAHPRILQALCDSNLIQTAGYGDDPYCREAADLIRQRCAAPAADVHFVSGGTQANQLVIHAALRSFEAAIAPDTGAEVLTGSTRLKAGNAQKMVLNMITTAAMVRSGYVYENLMINLKPSNIKLRKRVISIVREITDLEEDTAVALLERGDWRIKEAIRLWKEGKA